MRRVIWAIVVTITLGVTSVYAGGRSSSSHSSSAKTVHVRTYTKKDGTVVHAHTRAARPQPDGETQVNINVHTKCESCGHCESTSQLPVGDGKN